jgi:hypothetical protein
LDPPVGGELPVACHDSTYARTPATWLHGIWRCLPRKIPIPPRVMPGFSMATATSRRYAGPA